MKPVLFSRSPNAAQPQVRHARTAPLERGSISHFGCQAKPPGPGCILWPAELEDLGVAAYNGQATNLTAKALVPAAEIVSVEARHAAWIRAIAGKLPATGPTDEPLSSRAVMTALARTGFVKGLHR